MDDLIDLEKELRSKILAVRSGYQDVLDDVAAAKKKKAEAKERYNFCIDEGNEDGLRDCLKTIRTCNETIEGLPASRENFFGKIAELESEYKSLMSIDQQHIREAEATLDEATKALKMAKEKSTRVHGIRTELNGLKNLVVESVKVKSVSEDVEI